QRGQGAPRIPMAQVQGSDYRTPRAHGTVGLDSLVAFETGTNGSVRRTQGRLHPLERAVSSFFERLNTRVHQSALDGSPLIGPSSLHLPVAARRAFEIAHRVEVATNI